MIVINNLSKNFGSQILFENISLNINQGEKIGLLGPNGAGKTTLFSIILQETEPSAGSLQVQRGIRIGHLPQEAGFRSEHTVLSELTEGNEEVRRLKDEKEVLESKNEAGSVRYGEILHQLEVMEYFQLEYKAKKILMGLGFKEGDFHRPIRSMSGGWQMRTLLAKLLTFHYDLLLLDEPTNYLDLGAALWLKDFLAGFKGTFIMISHDKAFLNEVTNYTLILEHRSLFKVKGNYQHYERIKEAKRSHAVKQFSEQEKKRKQLEEFVARFHAQPNKAQQVRAKRRFLERMQEVEVPAEVGQSIRTFHFPPTKQSGYRVMKLQHITKSYGDIVVYSNFDFEITQGEKAILAGENGAGKSTLLKILAGVIPVDSGERIVGHHVDIGYFSQTRMDVLHPDNSVLDEAYTAAQGYIKQEAIRTILGAFLFSGNDMEKRVGVLSGGEKSRLILAKLLINPPNFLLLDEPTTHLDVDAVDALIRALKEYKGTVVCISHDIHFVRSVANVVFQVHAGKVRKFSGSFDYYLEKKESFSDDAPQPKPPARKKTATEDGVKQGAQQHVLLQKVREKQNTLHNNAIKQQIEALQKEREKLNLEHYSKSRAVAHPRDYHDDQMLEEYIFRLQEIEKRMIEIGGEIKRLRQKKIK